MFPSGSAQPILDPMPHRGAIGHRLALAIVGLAAAALAACGPAYPNCGNDDHCKAKGEYCLNTKCAQCRLDNHCPGADTDKCVTCNGGACGRKADCCTINHDCAPGKKCAGNKCIAQCAGDGDCAGGQKCVGGACVSEEVKGSAVGGGCKVDGDCGPGLKCKDGVCVDGSGACGLAPVQFAFNEYSLSDAAQNGISANLKCLKDRKVTQLVVEGHCDERGTDAYNMELGTKRARVVKEFVQASMPKLKVKTMSFGKTKPLCQEDDEGCWGRNRRAEFRSPDK